MKVKRPKKFDLIKQRLISTAKVLGPGAKFPTVRHLCQTLQVSVITLDKVLKQLELEGLIIRQHGSGIYVSPTFDRLTVGIVYDQRTLKGSPFHGLLTDALLKQCSTENKNCLFYLNYPTESKDRLPCPHDLYQDTLSGRLNGILTVGVYDEDFYQFFNERQIPLVALGSVPWARWTVQLDYAGLVEQATRRAIQKGAQRIGLLLPFAPLHSHHLAACTEVFFHVLKSAGLDPAGHGFIVPYHAEQYDLQQFGYVTTQQWLNTHSVDAIVSGDDMITFGILQALQGQPEKLPIFSHGNRGSSISAQMKPNVDILEFDPEKIVRAALQLLDEQLRPETQPEPHSSLIHAESE